MPEIRSYADTDLPVIEQIDALTALYIRYHGSVRPDNIVCAVERGDVVGVGYLFVPNMTASGEYPIEFTAVMAADYQNELTTAQLTDALIHRFREIKAATARNIYLRTCCEADDLSRMQFLLERGFSLSSVIPVLAYDLSLPVQHHAIPDGIVIKKLSFTQETMQTYLEADARSSAIREDEANVWFNTGSPLFCCFAAMQDAAIVGAASIWNISEQRGATENIFVAPAYRRKNIARELIATALDALKERGLTMATLSVSGTNLPAIKLYLSCGYRLYYNLLEMRYV